MHVEDDTSCQVRQEKSAESPAAKHSDEEEESDESELDDDYSPVAAEAGNSVGEPAKLKSNLSMKKKKTVAYPSELTSKDKKKKLLEYGTIKDKDDGKIIDDEADEQAEIQYSTI